ncbi:hypothetical protein B0H14DRAFT_3767345 [Mycena olivaceomarginata]|nr:hypothetical protein B0H14DRAFT_3767345 [Mycena olivaceomarginata]
MQILHSAYVRPGYQKLRSWRGGPRPQNKERGFESCQCESRVVRAMQEKAKNQERGIGYEPISVGQTPGIGSTEATKDTLVSTPSTAPRRALTETMPGSSDDIAVVLLDVSSLEVRALLTFFLKRKPPIWHFGTCSAETLPPRFVWQHAWQANTRHRHLGLPPASRLALICSKPPLKPRQAFCGHRLFPAMKLKTRSSKACWT